MKTLTELYTEVNSVDEKQTPSQAMQTRRKMARRMKLLAKRTSTKMKKKRMKTRRRDATALSAIAQRQAKMAVIKRSMGNVDYKELPLQKRIQIDQKIVAKKRKVIDKIAKKLLRGLKAGESKRIAKAKETQKNA
tara:strand:- start:856 stop:1260 length:405 start_codon:yes stop_codon:yes gene_type:complete